MVINRDRHNLYTVNGNITYRDSAVTEGTGTGTSTEESGSGSGSSSGGGTTIIYLGGRSTPAFDKVIVGENIYTAKSDQTSLTIQGLGNITVSLNDGVISIEYNGQDNYWQLDENGNLYTTRNVYSTLEVSAYGFSEGGGPSGGAQYLSELKDVDVTNLMDDGILQYNSTTQKWEVTNGSNIKPDLSNYATKDYVNTSVTNAINLLKGDAPVNLDTLGEIADAITSMLSQIETLQQLLEWFEWDGTNNAIKALFDLYSVGEITAYGYAEGEIPTGAQYLHELKDVDADNPQDQGILQYNATTKMWEVTDGSSIRPDLTGYAKESWVTQQLQPYATQSWVTEQINVLIGDAPDVLDTIYEIAEALNNDPDYVKDISNNLASLTNKVATIETNLTNLTTRVVSLEDMFEWDGTKIKAKADLYGVGEISAYGYSEGETPTGAQYLHELKDVTLTDITSGQLLQWNGSKWVNINKDEVGLNEAELAAYLENNNYTTIDDLTWTNISGKPTVFNTNLASITDLNDSWEALLKVAPTDYVTRWPTADEVGALTQSAADDRYALTTGTNATGTWGISITGNAATADKWKNERSITLSGAITGSIILDGSQSVTMVTTYAAGNIGVLDDRYVNIGGDTMTGELVAPTIKANTRVLIGDAYLVYEPNTKAVRVCYKDDTALVNLYATGEVSAYDFDGEATGFSVALSDLTDVSLTDIASGLLLQWNGTKWVNIDKNEVGLNESQLAEYLTSNNYITTTTADERYVNITGDTMSGTLTISTDNLGTQLIINRNKATSLPAITYKNTSGILGRIGVGGSGNGDSAGQPCFSPGTSITLYPILHTGNYTSTLDGRYVKKSGDTMTGVLRIAEGTTSNLNGIQASDSSQALLAYIGNDSYVAQKTGTTRIRSGATNLLHSRNGTDYTIWDSFNDGSGSGLDADTVDGAHNGSLAAAVLNSQGRSDMITGKPAKNGLQMFDVYDGTGKGYPTGYGNLLRLRGGVSSGCGELLLGWSGSNNGIEHVYYRNNRDMSDTWSAWRTLAFTTDNVASATKLQTARKIWGQSFNGETDVSGNMTGVGSITASDYIYSLNGWFQCNTSGRGLYNSAQDARWYATSGKWNTDKNIYPTTTNTLSLGDSSYRWLNVFANYGNFSTNLGVAGNASISGTTTLNGLVTINGRSGIGCSGFGVGLQLVDTGSTSLEIVGGSYVYGLGAHNNSSFYMWRGTQGHSSSTGKEYISQFDGTNWIVWGNIRPHSNNVYTIGTSNYRWNWIYGNNANLSGNLAVTGGLTVNGTTTLNAAIKVPYNPGSWINMAIRTDLIHSDTNNSASSAHALFRLKDSAGNAIVFGGLGGTIGFYGYLKSRIDSNTNGTDWSTVWDIKTGALTHNKALTVYGTTTLNGALAVGGTTTLNGLININNNMTFNKTPIVASGAAWICFGDSSYSKGRIGWDTSNNYFWIQGGPAGSYFLIAGRNSAKLEQVRVNCNNFDAENNITAKGEVTAFATSDRRLKTNVQPLTDSLSIIRQLDVVTFDWTELALKLKANKTKHSCGLIALDTDKILPDIVSHNMYGEGYLGIDYTKLIPFTLAGIQEVDSEVTKLKKRVEQLEERLSKYESIE